MHSELRVAIEAFAWPEAQTILPLPSALLRKCSEWIHGMNPDW
ncbi:hypothetical protein [Kozakia baliensis]|nr:hypothetical protein [Kozakia baliensis]